MNDKDKAFYHGCAIILGSLAREHGMPAMAVDIMNCNGITFKHLIDSGAQAFDLDPLREEAVQP